METFLKVGPLPKSLKSFNIREAHNWAEVLDVVESAKEAYEKKAKGKSGIAIKAGRYVSNKADVISPWLELLPNGDYSTVICGGLKFVFGAAAAQANMRSRILDALESLPYEIEEANECLSRFRGLNNLREDRKLKLQSLLLYLSILSAIEGMLQWLDGSSFSEYDHL